jgi:antitoxin component YwqK of YwqJK toxin-antitoxin module
MYKSILLFILLLYGCSAFSQEDTTWFDANWQKTSKDKAAFFRPKPIKTEQGYIIADHFANGQVQMKGISTVPDQTSWKGWVTWHYENGNVKQRALYKNNLIDSLVTYHKNGVIESVQPQRNGNIEGTALVYDSTAQLSGTIEFLNGRLHGEKKQFYQGRLWRVERFINGKLNGISEYYNDKGNIIRREHYKDDKREGVSEEFHENGLIRNRTHYVNDKRNGTDEDFDEDGKLKRSAWYINFDKHGPDISYYTNGRVQSSSWYTNDLPDSLYTVYERSGKLQLQTQFNKGILNGKYLRYNNGKTYVDAAFKNGSLQYWKSYYSNGKTWRESIVDTDSLVENWATYTESGMKLLETNYRFNYPTGTWKMFDEDGLALEIIFRPEYTKEAIDRKTRSLQREKREAAKKRKQEQDEDNGNETEDDDEENNEVISADEIAATTTLFESTDQAKDQLPAHYLSVEENMLDKENVFENFDYENILLHYGKSSIVFTRESKDSAIQVMFNGAIEAFTNEVKALSFQYITNADGLQLIIDHEEYKTKSNDLAMFAEPPSELVQRVLRFSIGSQLRKKIIHQPLLLGAIANHLYQTNSQGFSLAEISLTLCKEVFDKK